MTAATQTLTAASVTPHGTAATGARLFLVPSRSEPGESHVVALINNAVSCDCDGAYYRGRCCHQKAVEAFLLREQRMAYERRIAGIEDARRIVLAQLMGKPDDYLTA